MNAHPTSLPGPLESVPSDCATTLRSVAAYRFPLRRWINDWPIYLRTKSHLFRQNATSCSLSSNLPSAGDRETPSHRSFAAADR